MTHKTTFRMNQKATYIVSPTESYPCSIVMVHPHGMIEIQLRSGYTVVDASYLRPVR